VSTFLCQSSSPPLKVQSQNRPFLAIVILAISVLIIGIVGASPWRIATLNCMRARVNGNSARKLLRSILRICGRPAAFAERWYYARKHPECAESRCHMLPELA
jgi:hypothetical protein